MRALGVSVCVSGPERRLRLHCGDMNVMLPTRDGSCVCVVFALAIA